ncbi:MAG: glycoside hydrolase family 3 C-terminal domain-containing protein [Candidatus Limivivens sp.]|nr:glycoside hydrolase family 3 C-terminal domain-containing protein [Candidatus Limivivens sp.]
MASILDQLTIEEKASLLSQIVWETTELPCEDLEKFLLADGPAGIRRLKEYFDEDIYNTLPTTCYPSPSTYASSWNRELIHELGRHLGIEAKSMDVDVLLGPGVNLKRSPLGGRNFEYYSEDPYVTSELATEYIKGLQEEGTGACIKHFAVNNQETRRMTIDVRIGEEPLRELYLRAFQKPVTEGKPWMVMTAYNRVNGEYCGESRKLVGEILRGEWGYEGTVVTDCFAAHDLKKGIQNGLNLQMPGETGERLAQRIREYLEAGELTEEELDRAVRKNILLSERARQARKKVSYDREAHHAFARRTALESMVLLKNRSGLLPLQESDSVCVIGEMAEKPRFQGGGSSHVNPWKLETFLDLLRRQKPEVPYAAGYQEDQTTEELLLEARQTAAKADKVLLFLGLPEIYESEGYDRTDLRIPEAHEELLEQVSQVNPRVIVILFNGAPVEMPWIDRADALLEAYLPGEAGASALLELLYGRENPSGRLAETFPIKLSDTPCYLNFPGDPNAVRYSEGFLTGYRYYDTARKEVRFPFGFGLSYTEFAYSGLEVSQNPQKRLLEISVQVKNTGTLAGKEVVQIYVEGPDPKGGRPVRELKQFAKISLEPGEEKRVQMRISEEDLKIYRPGNSGRWVLRNGCYRIYAGKSIAELCACAEIEITSGIWPEITENTCLGDMIRIPGKWEILQEELAAHPRSLEFLTLCRNDNPLKISMGGLMSFQNLKRTDPSLKDDDIAKLLEKLNAEPA